MTVVGNFAALGVSTMAKKESRQERWDKLTSKAVNAVEELNDVKAGVEDIRDELQEWFDGMRESLQSSATGEALEEMIERCDNFIDTLEELETAANDIDGAEVPKGFGRD
jgi:prefoldin subunit 5